MATNRADTLDPALLRPGRLDRKIEFPLPNRREKRLIFQTVTSKMNLSPDVDLEDCEWRARLSAYDDLTSAQMCPVRSGYHLQKLRRLCRARVCKVRAVYLMSVFGHRLTRPWQRYARTATLCYPRTLRRRGKYVFGLVWPITALENI